MQDIYSNSSFFFFSIIDVKVAKTATSFWLFEALIDIVALLFIDVALDMVQVLSFILVFFCYLSGIDPNG